MARFTLRLLPASGALSEPPVALLELVDAGTSPLLGRGSTTGLVAVAVAAFAAGPGLDVSTRWMDLASPQAPNARATQSQAAVTNTCKPAVRVYQRRGPVSTVSR